MLNGERQVLAGDLEQLLERYRLALRAAVSRALPPRSGLATEDIEQEARMRLWRAFSEGRKIENFGSYVYRAGLSAAIDALRRAKTRYEEELSESHLDRHLARAGEQPETLVRNRQLLELARKALEELPADRRRVVGLHLQGFKRREIVQLTGWSDSKVRNLLHRGLRELRERCREAGVEAP